MEEGKESFKRTMKDYEYLKQLFDTDKITVSHSVPQILDDHKIFQKYNRRSFQNQVYHLRKKKLMEIRVGKP